MIENNPQTNQFIISSDNAIPSQKESHSTEIVDASIGELAKNILRDQDYVSTGSDKGFGLKFFMGKVKNITKSLHQATLTVKGVTEEKTRKMAAKFFNAVTQIFRLIKSGSGCELEPKSEKQHSYFENLVNKITSIFKKNKDIQLDVNDMKIHHLGGTTSASFDPLNSQVELDQSKYFYERVPVKVDVKDENGVIKPSQAFLYGNTLEKYVKEWIAKTESGETRETFSDFAAKRMADESVDVTKTEVRYFTDEDRRRTEITVTDGKLTQLGLDRSEEIKKEINGTYAFALGTVLDQETKKIKKVLLATPKVQTERGKIQHSSFFRGGNVLSAGMLEIDSETSTLTIRNQSGHYKPTEKG